ncbi:hypothetical protein [Halorubrum ezzemoulense]|uniref:hypothetical protein n=1 Tax=Halorubrum ezzemoulense TaxID=337243 RepID=UPI003F6DC24A
MAIDLDGTDAIELLNITQSAIIAARRDVGALKELTAAEWLVGTQEDGVQFCCRRGEIRPEPLRRECGCRAFDVGRGWMVRLV